MVTSSNQAQSCAAVGKACPSHDYDQVQSYLPDSYRLYITDILFMVILLLIYINLLALRWPLIKHYSRWPLVNFPIPISFWKYETSKQSSNQFPILHG